MFLSFDANTTLDLLLCLISLTQLALGMKKTLLLPGKDCANALYDNAIRERLLEGTKVAADLKGVMGRENPN